MLKPLLEALKLRIIKWLGVATKHDMVCAISTSVEYTDKVVERRVPELVNEELDRDERTVVFNSVVNVSVDKDRIQTEMDKKMHQAIVEALRKKALP